MKTKHAKSPCCHAQIYRFGCKRRQCSACKRTWSIRPRKRGRPRIRTQNNILKHVFLKKYSLSHLAERRPGIKLAAFRYRFRQTLQHFVSSQYHQKLPSGPLIVLADGLYFNFQRSYWVLYLIALKSTTGKKAVFLDPILLPKKESAVRWQQVLSTAIPQSARRRIRAIVVDNLNGMKKIAKSAGWILQLCHFHLILKFQVQHRRQRRALKGGIMREKVYQLMRKILELPNGPLLNASIAELNRLSENPCLTYRIQAVIREFLSSIRYYRAYIDHPELNLPSTTNTLESMGGLIRDLLRRNRSASSPRALLQWTTAFIRLKKELNCNGKHYQQI